MLAAHFTGPILALCNVLVVSKINKHIICFPLDAFAKILSAFPKQSLPEEHHERKNPLEEKEFYCF